MSELFSFDLSRSFSVAITEYVSKIFPCIPVHRMFNLIKLSITNEGLCTHACHSLDHSQVQQIQPQSWGKCIKNDIFIEFLLVRNQHLLKPSIIIIVVFVVVAIAVAVAIDDDDDEIKLLNIQKYRFWSNGFKAYTFQLGSISFLCCSVSNKQEKWKWNNTRNRSDPVVHGHCRPRPVFDGVKFVAVHCTHFKMYTIKIGHFWNVRPPRLLWNQFESVVVGISTSVNTHRPSIHSIITDWIDERITNR